MTEQTPPPRESTYGKYSFSAKIQNSRLSTWCFINDRTKSDRNTVKVSFSTDNRMADLLYILSRSSEVKVVPQGQVKHKMSSYDTVQGSV